jgi:hypothetical protein
MGIVKGKKHIRKLKRKIGHIIQFKDGKNIVFKAYEPLDRGTGIQDGSDGFTCINGKLMIAYGCFFKFKFKAIPKFITKYYIVG